MIFDADCRLAVYGTLAPGEINHGQLAGLHGRWRSATVRGWKGVGTRGSALGFPALTLDPTAPWVDVQVFESTELAEHWPRLDAFEGDGYQRTVTRVLTPSGEIDANIYLPA